MVLKHYGVTPIVQPTFVLPKFVQCLFGTVRAYQHKHKTFDPNLNWIGAGVRGKNSF